MTRTTTDGCGGAPTPHPGTGTIRYRWEKRAGRARERAQEKVMPFPERPGAFLRPSAQRSNHKKKNLALRWAGQGLMAGWNEGYEGLGAVHPAPFNATRAVTGLWRCPRAAIGAVQKACGRALWTRPKPTASVTQASASITFRCVGRLAAN